MEWVETTGRTVEEAKDAALDKLGIDESDAEFEVLEEPKVGLFGLRRAEARVRARVRPNQPRPKEVRRDRNRRSAKAAVGAAPAPSAEGASPSPAKVPAEPSAERSPGGRRPRPPKERPARSDVSDKPEGVTMDQDVPLRGQADVAREFLTGLLTTFEVDGKVDIREIDVDTLELAVEGGPELRLLIGHGGATLTAIQEITRRVVQRQTGARNGRLVVDVSGYRRKRKAALERFVEEIAADVVSSGAAKALEPMPAADRKVVHDTVNGLDGVSTTSEGEEPRRRVVISPS